MMLCRSRFATTSMPSRKTDTMTRRFLDFAFFAMPSLIATAVPKPQIGIADQERTTDRRRLPRHSRLTRPQA